MKIEEIKLAIEKLDKGVNNPLVSETIKGSMKAQLEKLKNQLIELEAEAEKKVKEAEIKEKEAQEEIEKAKAEGDKSAEKEAKEDLKEAKEEVKEAKEEVKVVAKVADKAEKVSDKAHGGARPNSGRKTPPNKMVKPKSTHGGAGRNQGRKFGSKMKKPKGVEVKVVPLRKKKVSPKKKVSVREQLQSKKVKPSVREKLTKTKAIVKVNKAVTKTKSKSVRAFGQVVEYKNDSDFCRQLISAFKKRKAVSKANGKRKKTKPVFGVIVTSTKNAVSKALHSVSEKQIEKNPKEFLAKATRLEKSAVRFLEDFKAILGSDYKKAEISSEFGELEKGIKAWIAKITK